MKPTRVIVPLPADVALVYDGRTWQFVTVPRSWLDDEWDCAVADPLPPSRDMSLHAPS